MPIEITEEKRKANYNAFMEFLTELDSKNILMDP